MHVKENLFGEDQPFTPMDIVTNSSTDVYKSSLKLDPLHHPNAEDFDPRLYRYNYKQYRTDTFPIIFMICLC